jgi:hypothetical protein
MLFYKMARKSSRKQQNNSMNRSRTMKKQKRSGGAKKGSQKKGGKLGQVDMKNLDNNKFWCMMCGRKNKAKGIVQGTNVKLETTKNGRKALRGKCGACGCKVFRFC